jgi:hypothetical protein
MDRIYKAAEKVLVYSSMEDHDNGAAPVKCVSCVPYSSQGLDTYRVDGRFYPGGVNKRAPDVTFVVLTGPGSAPKGQERR